jgi:hypothetical protein
MIKYLLSPNPHSRPNWEQIFEHEFIQKYVKLMNIRLDKLRKPKEETKIENFLQDVTIFLIG